MQVDCGRGILLDQHRLSEFGLHLLQRKLVQQLPSSILQTLCAKISVFGALFGRDGHRIPAMLRAVLQIKETKFHL